MAASRYHKVNDEEPNDDEIVEFGDEVSIFDTNYENVPLAKEGQQSNGHMVFYLLFFFLVNSLAFGLIAVPRINLVISLVCNNALKDREDEPVVIGGFNPQCQGDEVSSQTALIAARGNIIVGVFAAAISASMGRLSDRIGRVKVIAFNTVGCILTEAALLTIASFPLLLDYRWLYLAYAIDGISGSYALTMAMASAYVSDCCAPSIRSVQIGRLHGAMFIGIAVGPLLSTFVSSLGGNRIPLLVFYVALCMRLLSIAYLNFVPEPRLPLPNPPMRHLLDSAIRTCTPSIPRLSHLSPRRWLAQLVPALSPAAPNLRRNLLLLFLTDLTIYAGAIGTSEILILYPQLVFEWSPTATNLFMALTNAARACVATLALPLLLAFFRPRSPASGTISSVTPPQPTTATTSITITNDNNSPTQQQHHHHLSDPPTPSPLPPPPTTTTLTDDAPPGATSLDKRLLLTTTTLDLLGATLIALAPTGTLFTAAGFLAAFAAPSLAAAEASLTSHVAAPRRGELLGMLARAQGAVRVVAPSVVNAVYGVSVRRGWPAAAFWGVGGVLGVGVGLVAGVRVA
ncbi:MAG: Hippocampus abundant transcript 1 protein [Bathelium mastoideum]|nr:MAG: Hippocampus abundant transcript 1 protein [Bathelium mastoideum]